MSVNYFHSSDMRTVESEATGVLRLALSTEREYWPLLCNSTPWCFDRGSRLRKTMISSVCVWGGMCILACEALADLDRTVMSHVIASEWNCFLNNARTTASA